MPYGTRDVGQHWFRYWLLLFSSCDIQGQVCVGYFSIKMWFYPYRNSHSKYKTSHNHLIFIMGIPIPDEMIFILKCKPDFFRERHMFVMMNKISEHQVQLNRYSMDGDEETTIVDQDLYNVRDMTLDLPSKRVYWVDYFTQFIEFCNYDGSKRTRVHGSRLVSFNAHLASMFYEIQGWF